MKKNAKLNWVRLPIDNLENCRELGGYNTQFGQQTQWHAFLRSSEMSKLVQEDVAFLKEYGVRTVIDLRGEDEVEKDKNPLAEEDFCKYHNIPFITHQVSDITLSSYETSVGDFYVNLLEENRTLKRIFDAMDQAGEGCIVFHCQAGKDRTGIIAMLLLGIAGVEKKDIVSNYEVTYTNLVDSIDPVILQGDIPDGIPKEFLYSSRDYILRAYDYILETYKSVDHYLMTKGIEQDVIERVKNRLVEYK